MPKLAANSVGSGGLASGDGSPGDREHADREISDREITDRQLEVLVHVARGRTNRQIGVALGISERTVRNHLRSIGKRLAAMDRTHAVVLAIGNGWIAVPIEPETGGLTLPTPQAVDQAT